LQGRFRTQMKHNAGLGFEVGHDKVNNVPFKLEMSNLATTLTSWAKELHLEVPRGTKGDRIAHLEATHATQYKVDYQDAVGVHFVGSDKSADSATSRVIKKMTASSLPISSLPLDSLSRILTLWPRPCKSRRHS
jgi:hypothetical protein